MGGCLSSEAPGPRASASAQAPPAPPPAQPAPATAPDAASQPQPVDAGPAASGSNANGQGSSAPGVSAPTGGAPVAEPAGPSPSPPSGTRASPTDVSACSPAPGGKGPQRTTSVATNFSATSFSNPPPGDDDAARTLAAGGTLLSPPPVGPPDMPEPARSTAQLPATTTFNSTLGPSSDAGSFQNPEGSAAGGAAVQPSGFQCMPAVLLAKEVAQLSWVGHGGYGAVYKGVWQGANVAVKFTVADYMDFAGASAHEAVLSKMLSHPNVVQTFASRVALLDEDFLRSVFDGETNFPSRELPADSFRSGEGFGSPYGINTSMKFRDVLTHIGARPGHYITQMIMEYCDRGSLHQAINKGLFKSSTKWNNKIALRALLRTAREIAQGMSHLHACRVVHGDLKPGNVLLMSSRADRRGFTAKVSDFGLSTYCMASHTSVTRWSTVSYMAPEAFEGHLTMGSDTFSFGVLLWEMYTGQQPYAGLQAAQIVMGVQAGQLSLEWPPDSDPRIVELVEVCIARNPAARPTFLQLISQLTSLEALIRLEAPAGSEGASEPRMPLLSSSASGGAPGLSPGGGAGPAGALAAAVAAANAAAINSSPGPAPASNGDRAGLTAPQAAADGVAEAEAGLAETLSAEAELALAGSSEMPPLPSPAAFYGEDGGMPMLVPPPLPPEEEEEIQIRAAAAAAASAAKGAQGGNVDAAGVRVMV
ncbi:hypothetical protein HYH03_002336 [Edaphochlamys debaryana]|uniref:Protein kinase domain-containing protein n=1 Tax=Edaphochlamys debaryana TaxID=47281 RepID=A0A835YLU0_9CHLO|nr:hypothetical protein HYH03_002336 [Edaphochlamys debaryana]|eukprot:KAG2500059.1 hypothetical protein HYH03_002336 [Edaphochlamys debaryana]